MPQTQFVHIANFCSLCLNFLLRIPVVFQKNNLAQAGREPSTFELPTRCFTIAPLLPSLVLLLVLLLLASMLLSLPMLLLAPMLLPVFLLLLALLLLALLHYECCRLQHDVLAVAFFPRPCRKSLPVPGIRHFTLPHGWKFWSFEAGRVSLQGPDFYGREECKMSYSRDRPAFGNAKGLLPGTRRVFWHGGMWKRSMGAGKNVLIYQQRNCQSLVMQLSGEKLKQKGFFHSAPCSPMYKLCMYDYKRVQP